MVFDDGLGLQFVPWDICEVFKSEVFQNQRIYLGRVFNGFQKSRKESVTCILELVKSYDLHLLRLFLCVAGYVQALIKGYAFKRKCLIILMQPDENFDWTEEY